MTTIKDGTGTGDTLRIDATNKAEVHSVTETETQEAVETGDAYNINTGSISLTTSTASGMLYFKNNETRDIIIDAIAAGVGSAGTVTDVSVVTVIRNPTGGTLISDATAVDMNANRNFGSSKTLTGDAFKGDEGKTITGGNDIVQFFMGSGTRLFAPIDLVLQKGDSIAVKLDTNTSSGTTIAYAALVLHLKRSS